MINLALIYFIVTDSGDDTRSWGPPFADDQSVYFLSINRNKKVNFKMFKYLCRQIAINIKQEKQREGVIQTQNKTY